MATPPSSPPASPASPLNDADADDDANNGKDKRAGCVAVCPPPSFNDPGSGGNTRPFYLFPLFLVINVATMTDRSIIAGAGREFSAFVSSARDSPQFVRDSPDAGIGLLQAGFIFGYTVALLFSSHFVHTVRWKALVLGGMVVWWLAVLGSGNARQYDSFYVLLFCRMATGVSEAAFQVVAPPLIQDRGGERAGLWISIFLTGQPLGLSAGYSESAVPTAASSCRRGVDPADQGLSFLCVKSTGAAWRSPRSTAGSGRTTSSASPRSPWCWCWRSSRTTPTAAF